MYFEWLSASVVLFDQMPVGVGYRIGI